MFVPSDSVGVFNFSTQLAINATKMIKMEKSNFHLVSNPGDIPLKILPNFTKLAILAVMHLKTGTVHRLYICFIEAELRFSSSRNAMFISPYGHTYTTKTQGQPDNVTRLGRKLCWARAPRGNCVHHDKHFIMSITRSS